MEGAVSSHLLLTPGLLWAALCIWSGLEVCFFIYLHFIVHPRLEPPRQAPQGSLPPREILTRLIDTLDRLRGVYEPERFWVNWFRGVPIDEICRENVKEFLCWAVWHAHELTAPEDLEALEEGVQALERLQGRPFPPGHNPQTSFTAFTREPLHFTHRALSFYLLIKMLQLAGHVVLRLQGHTRYTTRSGLTYWHRPSQQTGPVMEAPLFFCHGITPGLWYYIPFAKRLAQGREVVLLEMPHIVTQLAFDAPDAQDVISSLGEIFERHNIETCAVAGHSFGSIVAGWAAASFPERVQLLILIDPVCLLLCLPDVAVNFLYRRPSTNPLKRSVKDLIDPSSEITVAHALRRHFWWHQKVVWLQDITCKVVVALSSEDDIVPSQAIRAYVARHYNLPDHSSPPPSTPAPASASTPAAADASEGQEQPQQQPQQQPQPQRKASSSSLSSFGSLLWGKQRPQRERERERTVSSWRLWTKRPRGRWEGSAWAILRNPRRGMGSWRTLFHRPSQVAAREAEGLPDARLLYWNGLGHGGLLFSLAAQDQLRDAMDAQASCPHPSAGAAASDPQLEAVLGEPAGSTAGAPLGRPSSVSSSISSVSSLGTEGSDGGAKPRRGLFKWRFPASTGRASLAASRVAGWGRSRSVTGASATPSSSASSANTGGSAKPRRGSVKWRLPASPFSRRRVPAA